MYEKLRYEKNEEINVMVMMKKVDNNSNCLCNLFSIVEAFKCSIIKIRITLSKPSNWIALELCNNLMNEKIRENIISKRNDETIFNM